MTDSSLTSTKVYNKHVITDHNFSMLSIMIRNLLVKFGDLVCQVDLIQSII